MNNQDQNQDLTFGPPVKSDTPASAAANSDLNFGPPVSQDTNVNDAPPDPSKDTGLFTGIKRGVTNLVHLPGAIYDAFSKPPQDFTEEMISRMPIGPPGSQVQLPPSLALGFHRLITVPMANQAMQADAYQKAATGSTNVPSVNGTDFGGVETQQDKLQHLANVHRLASMIPLAGPIAGDLVDRYLGWGSHEGYQDKSGAAGEALTMIAAPKVLEEAPGVIKAGTSAALSGAANIAGQVTGAAAKTAARVAGKATGAAIKAGVPLTGDYLSGLGSSLFGDVVDNAKSLVTGTATDAMDAMRNIRDSAMSKLQDAGITGDQAKAAVNDLVGRIHDAVSEGGSQLLGKVVDKTFDANYNAVEDPAVTTRLNTIAENLGIDNPIKVLGDSKTEGGESFPGAMASPSGTIYLPKDYLDTMSDGELAALISHEVSHVDLGHTSVIKTIGKQIVPAYSRAMETAADQAAVERLSNSGYQPQDLASSLEKIKSMPGYADAGSHPPIDTRIASALSAHAGDVADTSGFFGNLRDTVNQWASDLNGKLNIPEDATPISRAANTPAGEGLKAVATPGQMAGGLLATLEKWARQTGEGIGEHIAQTYDVPARAAADASLDKAIENVSPETAGMSQADRIAQLDKNLAQPGATYTGQNIGDLFTRMGLTDKMGGALTPELAFARMRNMSDEGFLNTLAKAKDGASAVRQGYIRYLADTTKDPTTGAYHLGKMRDIINENYGKLGSDAAQFKTLGDGLVELEQHMSLTNTKARSLVATTIGAATLGLLDVVVGGAHPLRIAGLIGSEYLAYKFAAPFAVDLLMKPRVVGELNTLFRAASKVPEGTFDDKAVKKAAGKLKNNFAKPLFNTIKTAIQDQMNTSEQ